uniref:receptor protein serine/threonine kinase n=1 Tax=Plecoglossus altivelis TaxID=61084 RepID=A0A8E4DGL8_PLEAT|nr:anti-Muellerian hormone type II receptor [Plecoglossus altivelis]
MQLSSGILGCLCVCVCWLQEVQGRRCAFFSNLRSLQWKERGNVSGSEQLCADTHCCVAYLWLQGDQLVRAFLGCSIMDLPCPLPTCFMTRQQSKCVCSSDLCNANYTWSPEQVTEQRPLSPSSYMGLEGSGMVAVNILLVCLVVAVVFFTAVKWKRRFKDTLLSSQDGRWLMSDSPSLDLTNMVERPVLDLTDMELLEVIGTGHFATVWRGCQQGAMVAVKRYLAGNEHSLTTEREVYELPLLVHAGIAVFLGAGRLKGGEMVLVLELAAYGSLRLFLSRTSCDWPSSLRLAQSLAEGLAFLHSEFSRHGLYKPAVAHRDLSSSNVLVRSDVTCALSDFSCSSILYASQPRAQGPGARPGARPGAPQTGQGNSGTLTQGSLVGTLIYMSPEVLEGSVNLQSSTWMMQGDVYALGLLLWEVWTRCSSLYVGSAVPEHALPYETELGAGPSLELLSLHVAERRQRPGIPPHWEQAPQGLSLQEIVTDCWDHDGDARLTSQGVVSRLLGLQA